MRPIPYNCFYNSNSPTSFFKWAIPGLFLVYFKQTKVHFLQQINVKNVHPVNGVAIRTHNLQNTSILALPLDQGSHKLWQDLDVCLPNDRDKLSGAHTYLFIFAKRLQPVLSIVFFIKNGPFPASCSEFCPFNTVENKQMFNINFTNHRIRTTNLWYRKQPLYQLCHNHCPVFSIRSTFGGSHMSPRDIFHLSQFIFVMLHIVRLSFKTTAIMYTAIGS